MRFQVGAAFWSFAVLLPVLTAALGPTYFISAPNVIRVGVDETIVINIFGTVNAGEPGVPVTVKLQDYPARSTIYCTQTVNVKKNEPSTITLRVNPADVVDNNNPLDPHYVYMHASSPSAALPFDEGTPILLSYKAGYTFIQTDKPIYTPNQEVFIRLVAVDQQMRPSQEQVRIDIITPQGIIVKRFDKVQPDAGFVSEKFQFPPAPMFGNWSIVAYYGHEMQHNATVQFLVKEYVLPTYSVKIVVQPTSYIISSYNQITTLLQGDYVFGEQVQGFYRIKYSLLNADGSMQLVKDGVNGTLNEHGQATHSLTLSDILGNKDFDEFLGKRLYIEAFIVEGATGKVESANNSVLQFVDSPFVFSWDQTLKYFKTNLPFEVKADVMYCYGEPVPLLEIRVSAVADTPNGAHVLQSEEDEKMTNLKGQVAFTLNVPQHTTRIVVTMTTMAGGELANFEQTDTFEILPFDSSGNNELLIRLGAQNLVSVSNSYSVDLQRNGGNQENVDVIFTYVVAGGKIIQAQAIDEVIANTVTDIQITQDMVPSARMVAFYVNDNNQVVADSLWIDVEDQCENPVEVSVPANSNGRLYYMPKDTVQLTLNAKPQTKIGLLAVDSAVYLLQDYHRLNKKKIFAKMASYDLGCGPGGGLNTQDIFKNAGVSILTNANLQTQERDDLSCDEHNRRRRAVETSDLTLNELLQMYDGNDTLTEWCEKGQTLIEGWNCSRRANGLASRKNLEFEDPIVQALYKCCLAVSQAAGRSGGNGRPLPPPKVDFNEVQLRTDFPESWLFENQLVDMGDSESKQYPISLPDSITTWIIQAVGVSPLHGMCVADNKEILVRRQYFLDVSLPYSVMRQEQVAIVATVYNYNENGDEIRVILQMEGLDGLCSNARAGEFVTEEGVVAAGNAKSFSFIVIPLEVQDYVVTIYMFSAFGSDAVRKTLHVVPEGVPQVQPLSIVLDPAGFGQQVPVNENNQVVDHGPVINLKHQQLNDQPNQNQIDTVTLTMPDDAVPNTEKCEVNLIGSLLGPIASAIIEGLNGGSFLQIPIGCGEQTMIRTAPNVYIFKYLKSIDKDTPEIEQKATKNIEDGISREVQHYRNADGSFKTFSGTPGNSWLTAFVLRVFCQAKEFAFVDDNVICTGMKWLSGIQQADGSFGFTYKTWHGSSFMGGVDEPIPLTAFVLITLSECDCTTLDTSTTVSKATMYLEGKLAEIAQDAHTMAIVTYALALVNSGRANDANTQLKALENNNQALGTKYFGAQAGGALTVETTAYALLAQITLGEISYSYPIVLWLMEQRDQVGNWRSTQDTMVALQALSTYSQRAQSGDIDMTCGITSSIDQQFQQSWHVQADNALVLHAATAPIEGNLVFQTQGVGIATLSVNLHYYKASGNQNLCPFEVTVTPEDKKPDAPLPGAPADENPKKKISIEVCAKYTDGGKTNMAIIDVGLFSGFKPIIKSLEKVTADTQLIQAYEVSDRSVIFYADQIPGGNGVAPLCVTFDAEQIIKVGNVQPVPVKVYDYYMPERECIRFYRPDGKSAVLETICHGDACECAAARCLNMDPEIRNKNDVALKKEACKSVEHFAYKATFVERREKDTFEVFVMSVTPLKKGLDQAVQVGQHRQFWKSSNCEHPDIQAGNNYLLVGKGGLPIRNDNFDITEYRHFIDGDFTVIHWPVGDQLREAEAQCKAACPKNKDNRNCRIRCRNEHRPVENENVKYFEKVENGFMSGCDQ